MEHHVQRRPRPAGLLGGDQVGMDETSARKGQDYISIFADLDARAGALRHRRALNADTVGSLRR